MLPLSEMAEEGGDDDMVCYFYSVQRINDYTFNSKVLDDVRLETLIV